MGRISKVRCSTRPDALSPLKLRKLKALGLDMVELGVQSFQDVPLSASQRNYSGRTAIEGCRMVQEAGLGLGVQLMPGMPGMSEEHFRSDIDVCIHIAPETARLYPCLVLEKTPLAAMWRGGKFKPWFLETILAILPGALLGLWGRGIRVIRMGLAPQPELQADILNGPQHPALGQMLRSRALFMLVGEKLAQLRREDCRPGSEDMEGAERSEGPETPISLHAPKRFQGEFFGHGGELKSAYADLGLIQQCVRWWDNEYFELLPAAGTDSPKRASRG